MSAPQSIAAAPPEPEAAPDPHGTADGFWSRDATDARAALRVERLQAMARLGLDLVENLHQVIMSGDADAQAGTGFVSLSRAVRQTVALEAKLDLDADARAAEQARAAIEGAGRPDHGDLARQRRDRARDAVEAAIEAAVDPDRDPAQAEWLYDALHERLDDPEDATGPADRPISLVVADICRDLGLEPDWDLWADADWAVEEALERAPGSPFLAVRDGPGARARDYRAMLRPSWIRARQARAPPPGTSPGPVASDIGDSDGGRRMAGELGLEPRMTVPKTAVLPLHHSPAGSARG